MILNLIRRLFGASVLYGFAANEKFVLGSRDPMKAAYRETRKATPNITVGKKIIPTHILLHHTSGRYDGSISWCMDPVSRVSYHCIVAQTGKRTVLASPSMRTWHAGISQWQGRKDCNNFCIGLAFEGDTYTHPPTEDALISAAEYLVPIMDEYKIPPANIIRHADVSPGRKNDCSPQALIAMRAIIERIIE